MKNSNVQNETASVHISKSESPQHFRSHTILIRKPSTRHHQIEASPNSKGVLAVCSPRYFESYGRAGTDFCNGSKHSVLGTPTEKGSSTQADYWHGSMRRRCYTHTGGLGNNTHYKGSLPIR